MASVKKVFLLVLLGTVGVHSIGPSNLTATVDSSKGDFADILVQWNPGDCSSTDFELNIQAPWEKEPEPAHTNETSFKFVNKEFWTDYTISLETQNCPDGTVLTSQVLTGPGNPHTVAGIETASSVVDANITIQEAFMPRPVDQYNATWCSIESCQTQVFPRANQGPAAEFDLELKGLTPTTMYTLTVVPEILFEGNVFRGPQLSKRFITQDIQLPAPSEVNADFPWDSINHQNVKLTWRLDPSTYEFAFFNVNVTNTQDNTVVLTQNVTQTEVLLLDVPVSTSMMAHILAFFNVSGQLLHTEGFPLLFSTPDLDPGVSNFTYENLNETTIYAEWIPSLHLLPNAIKFNFTYTNPKTNVTSWRAVNDPSIVLGSLDIDTTYAVRISVLSVVMGTRNIRTGDLRSEFKTLAKDYAAPVDFKVTPVNQTSDKVSYKLTWTSDSEPRKASKFQIKFCEQPSGECFLDHTSDTQIVVPFDYFANCDLTVSAVYRLKLNQKQIRHGQKINLQTPGTTLSAVTDVTLQNVTSEDAVLVWTAPGNVQRGLKMNYKIFDAASKLITQTDTESVHLVSLSPYSFYELHIQPSIMYNNTEFSGNSTSYAFYSDAAPPGAPDTVESEQIIRTNVFKVFWTEPKIANGQLDYYEVLVSDSEGEVVSNLTNLVGTKSTTVTLHSAHGDAKYNVNVRAVNVGLQNTSLPGNWTESTLLFKGIDPPTAEVIQRSSDSLTFKVTPSNTTTDKTGLFYSLTTGNTSLSDPSDQIELENLSAYTETTVDVHACYLPTFCSEPFTVTKRTNVDRPTQVNNLRGDFTNKTVPFINWTAPTTLNGPLDGYIVELRDLSNSSVKVIEILPADQTSYVYKTVMEFEKYNFSVLGFNLDLDEKSIYYYGEKSSAMVNTTGDHPPKPDNVQQLNKTSTSASFQWQKPDYPDFNVSYYLIQIPSLNIEEMTSETTITLDGLKPWTRTNILTSGCENQNVTSCGQPGSYDIVTSVDRPSEPLSITFTNVTTTEAIVSWEAPATPNGPITGYKIAVTESDNHNITWDQVEEKAAVHKLTNLAADTKYTVRLLAYNIDDDTGDELVSPVSIAIFTTEGSGGFAWWAIVVALGVVAGGAAGGVVYYKRRKVQTEDREAIVESQLDMMVD